MPGSRCDARLLGTGNRTVHTPEEQAELESQLVADLRLTAARYPTDRRLRRLIGELGAHSPRFVELWESDTPPAHGDRHKIVDRPAVGRIALDCDTLILAEDDLRIMVYSVEPGTEDADRLGLAVVIGTQALVE